MFVASKFSSVIVGMVLTTSGTSALFSPNLGNYLTAIGMVITGLIVVISYVRKEAVSHQKIQSGVESLQIDLKQMLENCAARGAKSRELGERVSRLEGEKHG